jgi:hypothetical protein
LDRKTIGVQEIVLFESNAENGFYNLYNKDKKLYHGYTKTFNGSPVSVNGVQTGDPFLTIIFDELFQQRAKKMKIIFNNSAKEIQLNNKKGIIISLHEEKSSYQELLVYDSENKVIYSTSN